MKEKDEVFIEYLVLLVIVGESNARVKELTTFRVISDILPCRHLQCVDSIFSHSLHTVAQN